MDSKVKLLADFYRGLPKDRAKVETFEHGFDFLERLLAGGVALEYGEMAPAGLLHKYKLSGIPGGRMNELLSSHVGKAHNVCLYFGGKVNSLFCFNLDNNHKTNNRVIIPEMSLAVGLLRDILAGLGCEPLVIASGRGYHLWCRLAGPVENGLLYDLMVRSMARALLGVHKEGYDYNKIKANFYPDPRSHNLVSLRLFGSEHMKSRVFSRVLAREGLLDEAGSWKAFEGHMEEKTIAVERVREAVDGMTGAF